ncbi:MAG TPA: GntR family transcriptional regulator [Deltaproteobacteria bacterium]|nr:GntR family transcriptional regulator [Deltaproteobacteria bacterium]
MDFEGIKKERFLREQVYKRIKDSVLNGILKPNARLIEEKLAKDMGTSRTPVREAIQKIEKEGLIKKLPKGGFAVNVIAEHEINEVFDVRGVLEGYAGYLATLRATESDIKALEDIVQREEVCLKKKDVDSIVQLNTEFHDTLYKSAKSSKLYAIINDLRDYIHRYRIIILRYEGAAEISIQDHKDMIALMKLKQARRVERLVRKHITKGKNIVKKKVRQELQTK